MSTPVPLQLKRWYRTIILLVCWVLVLIPTPGLQATEFASVEHLSHIQSGNLLFRQANVPGWQVIPGLKTRVKFNINGMLVRARVEQEFHNNSEHWINTTYVFPLPHRAAIDTLQVKIGAREIQGVIQPKAKARKIFQQAKTQGKKAALLQQHKADVFSTDIANIAPGESIKVQIEYQHLLDYQQGQFSLRFPLVAVPRYKPASKPVAVMQGFTPHNSFFGAPEYIAEFSPDVSAHKVEMDIELDAGLATEQIHSSSHSLHIHSINTRQYQITLDNNAVADRDFTLSWRVDTAAVPQSADFVEYFQQQQYGMLMLLPSQAEQQTSSLPRQVTLVIDTSGSMAGESIRQAKQAIKAALDTLSDQDSFNLIAFSSQPRAIFQHPRIANHHNKSLALRQIEQLEANGGTEMASALQLAFAQATDESYLPQVIFITDGSVDNEEYLFHLIKNSRGQNRLYTVGIGSAPNSLFMQYAAQSGKGTFTYIASAQEAKNKIQGLFKQIQQPVLANISSSFPAGTEFYPKQIPDLFAGQPLLVFYKSPVAMQDIQLTGQLPHSIWQQSHTLGAGKQQAGLHKLWAKAKIRDLTLSHRQYAQQDFVRQQITQTALQHQIISKYTSLVAVDDQISKANTEAGIDSKVPLPVQKGFGRLPQTATSADLKILLGALLLAISLFIYITRRQPHVQTN